MKMMFVGEVVSKPLKKVQIKKNLCKPSKDGDLNTLREMKISKTVEN